MALTKDDYTGNNSGKINKIEDIYGMLSNPCDILYFTILLDYFPEQGKFLELGTYIGGSLITINEYLQDQGKTVKFDTVDDIEELGPYLNNPRITGNSPLRKFCNYEEYNELKIITTAEQVTAWIKRRALKLTNKNLDLTWHTSFNTVGTGYDIIFQDFGFGSKECIEILNTIIPKLNDNGIIVIDDWDSEHIGRIYSTILAIQEGKLFPVIWGKRKAFFAKTKERATELTTKIANSSAFDTSILRLGEKESIFNLDYIPIQSIGSMS
jgi:predicted O-methyltransferase YrrM